MKISRTLDWKPNLIKLNERGDSTVAEPCSHTLSQTYDTYLAIAPELNQIKTIVLKQKPSIVARELCEMFTPSTLKRIGVNQKDWQGFIDTFTDKNVSTAKNAALVFLSNKTGLTITTLKTFFAREKKRRRKLQNR